MILVSYPQTWWYLFISCRRFCWSLRVYCIDSYTIPNKGSFIFFSFLICITCFLFAYFPGRTSRQCWIGMRNENFLGLRMCLAARLEVECCNFFCSFLFPHMFHWCTRILHNICILFTYSYSYIVYKTIWFGQYCSQVFSLSYIFILLKSNTF